MTFVMTCNRGQAPPELLLIQILKQCLESADQALLERRRGTNPTLQFAQFFAELQGLYDRDAAAQQRVAWESVRLSTGELNLKKWLDF